MKMIIEKMKLVKKQLEQYGETINDGASEKEIELFCMQISKKLNIELPKSYLDFLKNVNGIEFNGYIVYGIDEEFCVNLPKQHINGFISNNLDWYDNEWLKKFIFFGDSDISWYVFDTETNRYLELDKPSEEEMSAFSSFEEMIDKILDDMCI